MAKAKVSSLLETSSLELGRKQSSGKKVAWVHQESTMWTQVDPA
jgi:hypothetical protein